MVALVGKSIAIIPARGGSKRIPGKNILDFRGKPMIVWTIDAALRSGCFSRVMVSTDDKEIAEVSIDAGAEVPFMRDVYADDHSPISKATTAALKQATEYWGEQYELVAQLMANCPLRNADDIEMSIKRFQENNRDFQISSFKFGWMNPWWAVKLDKAGHPTRLFPEALSQRSQDLPELYCPTGAIWLAKAAKLLEHKTFYGPDHVFERLSWESAVDIDDNEDLKFAETVFDQLRNNEQRIEA